MHSTMAGLERLKRYYICYALFWTEWVHYTYNGLSETDVYVIDVFRGKDFKPTHDDLLMFYFKEDVVAKIAEKLRLNYLEFQDWILCRFQVYLVRLAFLEQENNCHEMEQAIKHLLKKTGRSTLEEVIEKSLEGDLKQADVFETIVAFLSCICEKEILPLSRNAKIFLQMPSKKTEVVGGKIRIALAEDHLLFRQGMLALLRDYEDLELLFDVGNGKELLEKLEHVKPDIILLDIDMPIVNGREALGILRLEYPDIKVIMLSVRFEPTYILSFIKNGASAFLPKRSDISAAINTIRSVYHRGHNYDHSVSEAVTKALSDMKATNSNETKIGLTKRELEVLDLIRSGKTNNEIAGILFISSRTAEWHRANLMQKTRTKTTRDLIQWSTQGL